MLTGSACVVTLLSAACSDAGPECPILDSPQITSTHPEPSSGTLAIGDSTRFRFVALDAHGDSVDLGGLDTYVMWFRPIPTVVERMSNDRGVVSPWFTAISEGTATVEVAIAGIEQYLGIIRGTAEIVVVDSATPPAVTVPPAGRPSR